ncbi:TetR/AcrR family transcriptional regulator [Nocardia sp. NPDC049526]|uniref:TetR/AcrR family transcriptional regulator n=1 Tax=Nocardia sp. NPDC049526 TaxID=3364316 RepID=UPI00379715AC
MTGPGARAGRPVNLQLRSAVLAATAELLVEHGYDSVTMEAIAARAGAAKQTLYRVWGSKAEVVADAVLQGAFVMTASPVPNAGDLRRDLAVWLDGIADYLRQPGVGSVVRALATASTAAPDQSDAFDRILTEPVNKLIIERLHAAQSAGDLAVRVSSGTIVDIIVGYLTLASIGRAPLDEKRIRELVAVLIP